MHGTWAPHSCYARSPVEGSLEPSGPRDRPPQEAARLDSGASDPILGVEGGQGKLHNPCAQGGFSRCLPQVTETVCQQPHPDKPH